VVLAVVLAGCDMVWSVRHLPDARPDAPAPDAVDAPDCVMFDQVVQADVILYSTTQDQGHGGEAVINIGVAQSSEGLQRFSVPAIPAGYQPSSVTLTETFATNASACSASCGSCAPLQKPGTFDVEWATSAWNEAKACYMKPDDAKTWQTLGAKGGNDRSASVGSGVFTPGTPLVIALDPTALVAWEQSGQISVILTPRDDGGQIVIPQKDYTSLSNQPICPPVPDPVSMRVTACR
jgi:hypothetical protein